MASLNDDCVHFVPFSKYDWTFARVGWLPWNPTAFCLIAAFCAIAYWMCLELFVLVYVTFKRHSGLYFWSIIVTTCGIILQTTGYILKEFKNDCPAILTTIICKLGWVANVSGFSIVLWSRLHLVVRSRRVLRLVLAMIIVDGILLHTPIVVCEFGLISRHHHEYIQPMEILERIQQTVFTVQETIIACLYIYNTARFLNGGYATHTRKVIGLLVSVQVFVFVCDVGLTTFDYRNMFTLKCTVHPSVYALKLKLEFIVLNQLLGLIKRGMAPKCPNFAYDSDGSKLPTADGAPSLPADAGVAAAAAAGPRHKFSLATIFRRRHGHAAAGPTLHDVLSPPTPPALVEEKRVPAATVSAAELHPVRSNSDETLRPEVMDGEADLRAVVGRPDDIEFCAADGPVVGLGVDQEIAEIERQYLGRWTD